jgi:hypothetical protein
MISTFSNSIKYTCVVIANSCGWLSFVDQGITQNFLFKEIEKHPFLSAFKKSTQYTVKCLTYLCVAIANWFGWLSCVDQRIVRKYKKSRQLEQLKRWEQKLFEIEQGQEHDPRLKLLEQLEQWEQELLEQQKLNPQVMSQDQLVLLEQLRQWKQNLINLDQEQNSQLLSKDQQEQQRKPQDEIERPFVYRGLDRQAVTPRKSYISPFRKKVEPLSGDFVIEDDSEEILRNRKRA